MNNQNFNDRYSHYSHANQNNSSNFDRNTRSNIGFVNQNSVADTSDDFYNQGAGYNNQNSSNVQSPGKQYNTGKIEREIVEKDKHGFLLLDPKPSTKVSSARRLWSFIVWSQTFLVPNFFISMIGKKSKEQRMAWREKLALCILIFYSWVVLLFVIIGLGFVLCPKQNVWTQNDILGLNTPKNAYISLRGNVYDISNFMNQRHGNPYYPTSDQLLFFAGFETNSSFPITIRTACPGLVDPSLDPNNNSYLTPKEVDENVGFLFKHTVGSSPTSDELNDPDFYSKYVIPKMNTLKKGKLVWDYKILNSYHKDQGLYFRVINGEVFNFGDYFFNSQSAINKNNPLYNFLDKTFTNLIDDGGAGSTDMTKQWVSLTFSDDVRLATYNCMKTLFYVGEVDTRKSVKCLFTNYMLLAFAGLLVFVVLVKFLAALQFGDKVAPLKQNKFVMCIVPCYTEGETSILRTINSLAALDYNDTRKLIFIVCDGNIVGSGNTRPTPRIVLDTLGVDPEYDPPLRDYLSLEEGPLEHNKAKVYSGLYDFEGHSVPFIVVVKVGNKYELKRPGNRGKRDSQILAMKFLSKAFFELPMNPLELEIYHHLYHVIGIHPTLFEFMFQIDADTEVEQSSLNRLVSHCTLDSAIVGICGETRLQNEKSTWVTMMQVYEYFISHNMAKAFESLFGSVTCLPGCFCMYRLYDSDRKPILLSPKIIIAYSERSVDTLHKKNLLSLGEDRYLTTLMLKHFHNRKLVFARDARCNTIAPESFSVYISQRRRWINSTVHNLFELVMIGDLCGFCCFSMRFVVILDLFGTLTIPTVLLYMAYLVYITVTGVANVGMISLIIIGAVYGLQAIIYILRREWQHIGWMIAYILFFPLWSFFLPIYSFWHFDDFSWGNTRTAVGDNDKSNENKTAEDDGEPEFDPNSIPVMLWPEYEQQLIALGTLNEPPVNPEAFDNVSNPSQTPSLSLHNANMAQQRSYTSMSGARNYQGNSFASAAAFMGNTGPASVGGFSTSALSPGNNYPMMNVNNFNNRTTAYSNVPGDVISPYPINQQPYNLPIATLPQNPMAMQQAQMQQINPTMTNHQQLAQQRMSTYSQGSLQAPSRSFAPNQRDSSYSSSSLSYQNQLQTYNNTQANQGQHLAYQQQRPTIPTNGSYPSYDQIYESVAAIIARSNIEVLSKKAVRSQLSVEYGVDMMPFKDFISESVDQILSNNFSS
ncbi:Chitin synthase 6 [Smittium culicis]|uniref:chitin synthase n=1 Tax=Smittium culicis TaxID=133412 RepID=A0A1R1YQ60_9FUNG|nr:Chitin synthase 6 [Smittium culicis]